MEKGGRPRDGTRCRRRRPKNIHGLLRAAADIQLDEEPDRVKRSPARGQRMDVPRQQFHVRRLCGTSPLADKLM